MKRAALLSVSDKTNLQELAEFLVAHEYELLCSSGTARFLTDCGIVVSDIESYTGQQEILGGRVKTLHPKIHAGILARRDQVMDMQQLEDNNIIPIDVVVVNLYPFVDKVNTSSSNDLNAMIEFIDIGGPAMIRAAAKNHQFVLPLVDPADYVSAMAAISSNSVDIEFRRSLASKVFAVVANNDLEIARFYSGSSESEIDRSQEHFGNYTGRVLSKALDLRYGENPHQQASYYRPISQINKLNWRQLSGKELSYNNLLDIDAAYQLIKEFSMSQAVAIFKHLNPCGVARDDSLLKAFKLAKQGDPRSHFGGIVAFSSEVHLEVAKEVREGFVEIVLAPKFSQEAVELLSKNKNLRIIEMDLGTPGPAIESRSCLDGVLVQTRDRQISSLESGEVVSKRQPSEHELLSMEFAWRVCAHVKSNAIVIARDETILAIGAGQMSRIDSAELAISKARTNGNSLKGSVVASDAFFPFGDSLEELCKAGATAIVAPGGSKRDADVIEVADSLGAALVFMGERHFKH